MSGAYFTPCEDPINTSIAQNETINSIEVYPNPFTSELNIKSNFDQDEKINLAIVDMQGRIVNEINNIQTHDREFKISTKGILNGIYFLRITNKNNSFTIKIIKD